MQTELFIDGQWVKPVAGGTLRVIDPATEEVFHHIPAATAPDAEADEARCQRVARAFRAGIVWINCSQPTFTEAPWGGMKQSGIGRELGRWGLDNYLETKQITELTSEQPWGWYIKG